MDPGRIEFLPDLKVILLRKDCAKRPSHQRLCCTWDSHQVHQNCGEPPRPWKACGLPGGNRPIACPQGVLILTTAHLENASRFSHLTAESVQQQENQHSKSNGMASRPDLAPWNSIPIGKQGHAALGLRPSHVPIRPFSREQQRREPSGYPRQVGQRIPS